MTKAKYSFAKDKYMQALGSHLFPEGEQISVSKNPMDKKILSFLITQPYSMTEYNQARTPKDVHIKLFPVFDTLNEHYNLCIMITLRTPLDSNSFTIVIDGTRPDEQNHFLDALDDYDYMELWTKTLNGPFLSCMTPAPKDVEIFQDDLLIKIRKWNNNKIIPCDVCGADISIFAEATICQDCLSQMTVLKHHQGKETE